MTVFALPVPNAQNLTDEASGLLTRLAHADPAVRRIALVELADVEDAALLPAFVATVSEDPAPEVRR
jgi:hypothetical protein